VSLYWTDRVVAEEASEDAIWVGLVITDEEVASFEGPATRLAYRQFRLPPWLPARFALTRADEERPAD
jgi:hypothetical protein